MRSLRHTTKLKFFNSSAYSEIEFGKDSLSIFDFFFINKLTALSWTLGEWDIAAAIGTTPGTLVKTLHPALPPRQVASPMYILTPSLIINVSLITHFLTHPFRRTQSVSQSTKLAGPWLIEGLWLQVPRVRPLTRLLRLRHLAWAIKARLRGARN
jgi:hypothetical protein